MTIKYAVPLLFACALAYGQNGDNSANPNKPFGCESSLTAPQLGFTVSQHFADVQKAAVNLSIDFCNALNDPIANELPLQDLVEFGLLAENQAVQAFSGTNEQADVAKVLRLFAAALDSGAEFPTLMPDFDVAEATADPSVVVFYSSSSHPDDFGEVSSPDNASCIPSSGVSCKELLMDLGNAINPYKRSYQISNAANVADQLTVLHNDWNSYFDNARSMTTLDLALTTLLESEHMRQGFLVGPVKRQWFALHPNLVLEYVSAATDGDKFKGALAIEWFGVNYWNDGPFGVPIGFSLTSVYSDRINVKDIGHGLTLHLDNRYSVGWVRHGDESAYNVSVDLLEFFKEKQSEFNKYKARIRNLK